MIVGGRLYRCVHARMMNEVGVASLSRLRRCQEYRIDDGVHDGGVQFVWDVECEVEGVPHLGTRFGDCWDRVVRGVIPMLKSLQYLCQGVPGRDPAVVGKRLVADFSFLYFGYSSTWRVSLLRSLAGERG